MTAANSTPEKLQRLLDRYVSDALEAWEDQKASTPGPFHEGFPAGHAEVLRILEAKTKDALARNSIRFFEPTVDALLAEHGIALEKDSLEYRRFALEVMKREVEAARIGQARAVGDYSDQYATASRVPPVVQAVPQVPAHLQVSAVTLKEGIAKYLEVQAQKGKRPTTLEKYRHGLDEFLELVGDKPVASLVRDDMREYCRTVHHLPKNRTRVKAYNGKTIQQLLHMTIPAADLMTNGAIDDRFVTVSVLLNWLADEYPMTLPHLAQLKKELEVSRKAPTPEKRRAYTEEELRLLFEPTVYTSRKVKKAWQYWLPLLGLLTGARLGELCQLLVTDIKKDDASGVWYFDINDEAEGKRLKTDAAKRKVPMHPALVELGLLKRVKMLQRRKETHLFPGLFLYADPKNPAKAPSKWFSDFRQARGLGAGPGEVSPLTYHSLRHTFLNRCMLQDLPRRKYQAVVGHEAGEFDDVTAGYEGGFPITMLYDDVVARLDFGDVLDMDHLKSEKWQETL
jgi:Phage integrase family.